MPGSYIFLFCLASLGRILSETKGDRRHVEPEIQMLMVYLRGLTTHNCRRLVSNMNVYISF